MKMKIRGLTVLLLLLLVLTACSAAGATSQSPTSAASAPETQEGITIGGYTVALTVESTHGALHFRENYSEIEKSSYESVCNLVCRKEGEPLFIIRMVYFEGKSIEEVMTGTDADLSEKNVGGLTYRVFGYDDNGMPGRTYLYDFEGTTYSISFASTYDTAALEEGFLANVRFEKE